MSHDQNDQDQARFEPSAAEPITPAGNGAPPRRRPFLMPRLLLGIAAVGLLAVGLGVGAVVATYSNDLRAAAYAPLPPVAISAMTDSATVAIKGQVAEIFGNKFIMEDPSGRALVETGPKGEDGDLVAKGEAVTIQGRFENGFLHATFIVHEDGETVALDQPHPPRPPHGPLDWLHGPRAAADQAGASVIPAT